MKVLAQMGRAELIDEIMRLRRLEEDLQDAVVLTIDEQALIGQFAAARVELSPEQVERAMGRLDMDDGARAAFGEKINRMVLLSRRRLGDA